MIRHHGSLVAAVSAVALLLTGCGGAEDTDPAANPEPTVTETVTEYAESSPTNDSADDSTEAGGASDGSDAGLPPRPAQDECVRIEVPSEGNYTVYDAGRAVVRQDGQRLVLGDVQAASGWTANVDSRDRDEVEIEFRSESGEELEVEVEIDDGQLKSEICADDD